MRKPIIVGNWKMNHGIAETKEFVAAVDGKVTDKADWGIATPFLDLATAKEGAKNLIVAAENCHFKDSGAYTGEVSVGMLKEIGVECVIKGRKLPFFDYHCPLLSLPYAFKTSLETIPPIFSLKINQKKIDYWKNKFKNITKPKIALAWSGNKEHKNDHNRSLSLEK